MRWRLWVDGCGGFLLLGGDAWSVGAVSHCDSADIGVRADWPRLAGQIRRQDDDYLWIESASSNPVLISDGQTLPIPGSAAMTLTKPSPLCRSARLNLSPPHRFADHMDGVVLVADALLIGPDSDCHIRTGGVEDRIVLTRRNTDWLARVGLTGEFTQLSIGNRLTFPSLTMTLETA
tara:strand:+ start:459162 stop:459692 length:531 start_codon:yes stop_codon:yes gene_type:complete